MSGPVKQWVFLNNQSMTEPVGPSLDHLPRYVLATDYDRLDQECASLRRRLNDSTGQIARRNIYIDIAESLLSDPDYEMSGSDLDYEHPLHDKIKALKAERDAALKLLERCQEHLHPHRDAILWGDVCAALQAKPCAPTK